MRRFKNKNTKDIVEEAGDKVYKGHFYTIPKKFVENSNDWQEMIEYPIGTKVYNSQIDSTYTKKEDGWYNSPEKTAYTDEDITKAKYINVVVEKNWEILSFKSKISNKIARLYNGKYLCNNNILLTKNEMLYNKDTIIYSIKRLSDGEIFSIEDYIICENSHNTTPEPIIKIELNKEDNICLYTNTFNKNGISINKAIKKEALFTTFDGVEIFEETNFWYVDDSFCLKYWNCKKMESLSSNYAYLKNKPKFLTRKAAQAYIDENKPKYSESDILNFAAYFKASGYAHLAMLYRFRAWKLKNNK